MNQPSLAPSAGGLAGIAVAGFAAVAISLSLVLSSLVYGAGSNPATVICVRTLVFAVAIAALIKASGRSLWLPRGDRWTSLGLGLVYLMGGGGYLWSIQSLPVSLAVLMFYTYPLLTLAFASLLERRPLRAVEIGAFAAAFAGLALALDVQFDTLDPEGLVAVAIGSVGAALAFVLSARTLSRTDTSLVTLHMAVSGFVVALIFTLASGSLAWPQTGAAGWLLLAAIVVCFVAGFFAMYEGVKRIGAVRTAMVMNLEPLATIVLAVTLLSESLTLKQVLGAALVISAILVAQRTGRLG